MRVGSLFSGIGGMELALEACGAQTAWQCENDPAASAVLRRWWPNVPNLGDITNVNWSAVERVEILCGGFPCPDISYAGKGAGIANGTRSGLWFAMRDAIRVLRPRVVFVENVAAILTRGIGVVIGDLAALGYDTRWGCIRASDVGAPHRRDRWFAVAIDANCEPLDQRGVATRGETSGWRSWADTCRPTRTLPFTSDNSKSSHDEDTTYGHNAERLGDFEPAVRRWEAIVGPAPDPLDDRERLNPDLTDWMMGFGPGWTAGLQRTQRLRCAGNAVVPHQALRAYQLLSPFQPPLSSSFGSLTSFSMTNSFDIRVD